MYAFLNGGVKASDYKIGSCHQQHRQRPIAGPNIACIIYVYMYIIYTIMYNGNGIVLHLNFYLRFTIDLNSRVFRKIRSQNLQSIHLPSSQSCACDTETCVAWLQHHAISRNFIFLAICAFRHQMPLLGHIQFCQNITIQIYLVKRMQGGGPQI